MTLPVGVYDLYISKKAFKVTVKDASWKWEPQGILGTNSLQHNAQLLFFPLWQPICEQHREADAPCDHREGPPGSSALQESGLQLLLSSLLSHQQPHAQSSISYSDSILQWDELKVKKIK